MTGDAITAVAPADVTYYVNDSQVEITDKNAVHLLTDEVLDDQVLIDHISNEIIGSDTASPTATISTSSNTWIWWTAATATPM